MPFGKYKNFKQCVRANKNKKSPGGYCAVIEKKITGHYPHRKTIKKRRK